jgi:hypothetical protein
VEEEENEEEETCFSGRASDKEKGATKKIIETGTDIK